MKYVDERDDENLILTHIYLLLGVSYGLFLISFDRILANNNNIFIGYEKNLNFY